jgi:hypothetical protein
MNASTIESIETRAKHLRVPMTHVPRDPEYLSVLEYRIGQEISAAEHRVASLRELLRDVERAQTPVALPLLDANSDNPLEASIARARALDDDPFVRRDVLDAMSDDELREVVRDGGPAAVIVYAKRLLVERDRERDALDFELADAKGRPDVVHPDALVTLVEYEIVDDATGEIVFETLAARPLDALNAYMDVVEIARYPEDGLDPNGLEPDSRLWYDDGHGAIDATFSNTNLHVRPVAHDYAPDWHPGDPVPDGFEAFDGNAESGPCEPMLVPIERFTCDTCGTEQRVVERFTVNPADPTAAYKLACGHVVI